MDYQDHSKDHSKDHSDFMKDYPGGYSRGGYVYNRDGKCIGFVCGNGDYRITDGSIHDGQLYSNH